MELEHVHVRQLVTAWHDDDDDDDDDDDGGDDGGDNDDVPMLDRWISMMVRSLRLRDL